jgi:uncharacterized membrane protein
MEFIWIIFFGIALYYLLTGKFDHKNFSSVEQLNKGLAKGDISIDEYQELKNKIN